MSGCLHPYALEFDQSEDTVPAKIVQIAAQLLCNLAVLSSCQIDIVVDSCLPYSSRHSMHMNALQYATEVLSIASDVLGNLVGLKHL